MLCLATSPTYFAVCMLACHTPVQGQGDAGCTWCHQATFLSLLALCITIVVPTQTAVGNRQRGCNGTCLLEGVQDSLLAAGVFSRVLLAAAPVFYVCMLHPQPLLMWWLIHPCPLSDRICSSSMVPRPSLHHTHTH